MDLRALFLVRELFAISLGRFVAATIVGPTTRGGRTATTVGGNHRIFHGAEFMWIVGIQSGTFGIAHSDKFGMMTRGIMGQDFLP